MEERFLDKTLVRVSVLVMGVLTVLFSLPFTAYGVAELFTSADTGAALMLIFFFGICSMIGAGMSYWGFKRPKKRTVLEDPDLERRLLQFARNHRGVVTVSQLAAESPLSASEARTVLERLERVGICHSAPSSTGGLFYRFPDFMPDGTRTQSEVEFDFSDDAVEQVMQAAAKQNVD